MKESFDPYLQWLAIRDPQRPPNHYRMLGIDLFESDIEVIQNAADRQMAHVRRFQGGKHSLESQRLLNELATAKVCLLQPEKKAAYDATLRAEGFTAPTPAMPPPVIRDRDFSTPPEIILIPSRPLPVVDLEGKTGGLPQAAAKNKILSLSLFLSFLAAVSAILIGLIVLLSNANKKTEEPLPASPTNQTEVKPPYTDNK